MICCPELLFIKKIKSILFIGNTNLSLRIDIIIVIKNNNNSNKSHRCFERNQNRISRFLIIVAAPLLFKYPFYLFSKVKPTLPPGLGTYYMDSKKKKKKPVLNARIYWRFAYVKHNIKQTQSIIKWSALYNVNDSVFRIREAYLAVNEKKISRRSNNFQSVHILNINIKDDFISPF